MTHPFDGVAPVVVVVGVRFVYGTDWLGYETDDGKIAVYPNIGYLAVDYNTPDTEGDGEKFYLSTRDGFDTFRKHLRETRGGA